ncbi:MafI family immunity protein [Paenibacillus sp. MMO-58]|uniref:MafI family immunity protein n=1 Tax=Paenibacillus sp. MMO-58 TaxID=3081290 RepID=UPI00301AF1E0
MSMVIQISNILEQITIPDKDRDEILEYLDHNEWGIALEHLCATIIEEDILITESLFDLIKKIGEEMKLDTMTWWEDSRNRVIE